MLDPKTRRMYYAVNDHVSEDAKKLAIMIGVVEGVNPAILSAYGVCLITKLLKRNKIMLRKEIK